MDTFALLGLGWRWCKLGAKDDVPESTCYTKAILVIHKVVLEMIFLQLPPVRRQGSVVQEVMGQVVANIAEYTSTEHCCSNMPIPVENEVCEFPEGNGEGDEKRRWHDQPQLVHWQVVVNAVEKKVESNGNTVIRKEAVKMEQKSVQNVFHQCPEEQSEKPVSHFFYQT